MAMRVTVTSPSGFATALRSERLARVDSPWRVARRRFFRHRLATAGLIVSILLLLSALLAPVLAPRDPLNISILDKFTPPLTKGFLLGADEVGRDLVSRLLYAGRI